MTMTNLRSFLDDYEARNPGFAARSRAASEAFWADVPDVADFPAPGAKCTEIHRGPEGPNEDLASCPSCWGLTYALRPDGESFGWHIADCSLPLRHEGYCAPGGSGHVKPEGWKLRG